MRKAMSVIAVAFRGSRTPEDARHLGVGLSASEIGKSNVRLFLGHDTSLGAYYAKTLWLRQPGFPKA